MDKMSFEIEKFDILDDYSDEQFAVVQLYVCHDGNNLHDMPIDLGVIKEARKTLINKPLIAGFDGIDFKGHEPTGFGSDKEIIVGFFPESSKMFFEEKDGRTYLVAQAIMFKIYAEWAYNIFLVDNERAVSMEITVLEIEEGDDGLDHIAKFIFNGVTVLGKTHVPACEGANASIIKFSAETRENASQMYSKHFKTSNKIKQEYVKEMKVTDISGKEGIDNVAKNKEKDFAEDEVINSEEGAEKLAEGQEPEEKLDGVEPENTPVAEEPKEGEQLTEGEKPIENEESEKEIEFESLTQEQKYTVLRTIVSEELGNDYYLSDYDDEYIYVTYWDENWNSIMYRYEYSLNGTECSLNSESKTRVMAGGYTPFEAEGLETQTEEPIKENEEPKVEEDNSELEALKIENDELKEKLATYEKDEKDKNIESILSGVIDLFSADEINDFRAEAQNYSLTDLHVFENKVKAIAFEVVKDKTEKDGINRMSIPNNKPSSKNKYTWD